MLRGPRLRVARVLHVGAVPIRAEPPAGGHAGTEHVLGLAFGCDMVHAVNSSVCAPVQSPVLVQAHAAVHGHPAITGSGVTGVYRRAVRLAQ